MSATRPDKPVVFIGSSAEGLPITRALQSVLKHDFRPEPWTAGTFSTTQRPLADLENKLRRADFAVFAFEPDDIVLTRGVCQPAVRDNVIFELGLFVGRLGSDRCFILIPDEPDREPPSLPSDLDGFRPLRYDAAHFRENAAASIANACSDLHEMIRVQLATAATTAASGAPDGAPILRDMLDQAVDRGAALADAAQAAEFAGVVLSNCLFLLRRDEQIPEDASAVWLRPDGKHLKVFAAENLALSRKDYRFEKGEGLAGKTWRDGATRVHSGVSPHPDWVERPGCTNATYLCVAVRPSDTGGVLGVGSDEGFEPTRDRLETVRFCASLLRLCRTAG